MTFRFNKTIHAICPDAPAWPKEMQTLAEIITQDVNDFIDSRYRAGENENETCAQVTDIFQCGLIQLIAELTPNDSLARLMLYKTEEESLSHYMGHALKGLDAGELFKQMLRQLDRKKP